MKNYTITEEQIKKLSTQDQIVEEYLNEWFPEAFKKELEIGKWYKNKKLTTTIINCQVFNEYEKYGYGFHVDLYSEKWGLLNYKDYTEATEEEIKSELIKEADRRGFKANCLFESAITSMDIKAVGELIFYPKDNSLFFRGGGSVFKNGKWGKVKEEITLNYQQIADKFGINVEQLRITKL